MATIKALISGQWVEVGGPDEVFIGPNDPGAPYELWYDSDDPGSGLVSSEFAQFTPTLNSIVPGTGGSVGNSGFYQYVGGPGVGGVGQMTATGVITFGTSGQTFPGSFPGVFLPPGFDYWGHAYNLNTLGGVTYNDAGVAQYQGLIIRHGGANNLALLTTMGVGASYPGQLVISATIPFTWGAGDQISWTINALVVRV